MSRWYRAYEGTVTDAKLGEVAMLAECSRSVAIAAWHSILESCACANDAGRFDVTPRRVAVILGEPLKTIEAVFAGLTEIGLIADGVVCSWQRRQFESDSSTERSRKHRQQKRNADATLQQRDATPPETETETDTTLSSASANETPNPEREFRFAICDEYTKAGFLPPDTGRCVIWLQNGWQQSICVETVRALLARKGKSLPLSYIEPAIADAHAPVAKASPLNQRAGPRPSGPPPSMASQILKAARQAESFRNVRPDSTSPNLIIDATAVAREA